MSQLISTAVFFLAVLALVPLALRWVRQRSMGGAPGPAGAVAIVSAAAVGPQQRVVTVEVGPPGQRVWLVLGVTAQAVNCLHRIALDAPSEPSEQEAPERQP